MRKGYISETLSQLAAKASFQVVDDTDHLTSEDALSLTTLEVRYPTVTAWATLTSVATNVAKGWYEPNGLTSAAQTVGTMLFHLPAAAGYDPVDFGIVIDDKAAFKADVSALALEATVVAVGVLVANLRDYDPEVDTVEGSETYAAAQRLIRAETVGNLEKPDANTHIFKNAANTKNRITGTVDEFGARTVTAVDGSEP